MSSREFYHFTFTCHRTDSTTQLELGRLSSPSVGTSLEGSSFPLKLFSLQTMGASSSITSNSGLSTFTSRERKVCEETWNRLLDCETPPPFPHNEELDQQTNNPKFKSFRMYFYSLCFQSLKLKVEENQRIKGIPPFDDPNILHTIMIFMLKFTSIFVTSLSSQTPFRKYARALAISSCHLGISPDDFSSFESAFLDFIRRVFPDDQTHATWKNMFSQILQVVVPECEHVSLTMSRPLRASGGGTPNEDTPESEIVYHFAEYAFKLLIPSNEVEDPNSVNRRLYTCLDNSIEY
jgi:hypothetical protein